MSVIEFATIEVTSVERDVIATSITWAAVRSGVGATTATRTVQVERTRSTASATTNDTSATG